MSDRGPRARGHARAAARAVLAGAGSTMVTFNIWHALHTGGLKWLLAIMVGVAPAGLAIGLSHIVAAHNGGKIMRGIAFLVMTGAMVLSVSATGDVVRPAVGPLWWLFGAVVDSAALVALQVILTPVPVPAAESAVESVLESAASTVPESALESAGVPLQGPQQVPSRSPSEDPDSRAARTAYRKSAAEGRPLSEAALGAKYGKSRTWGRNRISEVRSGPARVSA